MIELNSPVREFTMIYRAYTSADREACLTTFDSNFERDFSAGDRENFETFLAAPGGFFGVLCDDTGTVVGCGGIGLREDGETAVLTWGMIYAHRHRQGLGKRSCWPGLKSSPSFLGLSGWS